MRSENIDYKDGDLVCEAYVSYDDSSNEKRPCVLVSHAWGGQSDGERQITDRIAGLGYIGFALDNYGKGNRGNSMEENSRLMQPFMDDRSKLLGRLKAGISAASEHPLVDSTKIAAIGYCFGGLCVLDIARSGDSRVSGVVSFHGLFEPPGSGSAEHISAKVLILHGYDDPMAKPDSMIGVAEELTKAGADWQIHAYGNTMHAFSNPHANMPENGILYNESAAKRSWESMTAFLNELF